MDATIEHLLMFCQADPTWFEPLWRLRDHDRRFATVDRPLPAGWTARAQEHWVLWEPPALTLPEQGWKVHISATEADAPTAARVVGDFCLDRGIAVKFLRSTAMLRFLNSKYVDRGGAGKFITLYPADEDQLTEVLPALAARLAGVVGPYILSDLRFEDSCVYVRYGAFTPMVLPGPDGEPVLALRDAQGSLVPDRRLPVFAPPPWAPVPAVLQQSWDRYQATGEDEFPYHIESPLHFSNGGGVYLGRPREGADTDRVVLREARPYAGLDADGTDAVARLARERDTMRRLDGLPCVPLLLDSFTAWEHRYLVEEHVDGRMLMEEVFDRYPLVRPDTTADELADYTRWAIQILARVDRALAAVHARGVRFVDLHPGNVMVRPDGSVVLIDFEIATDLADTRSPGLGAPGFCPPDELSGKAADGYSLDCLRLWMFLPISPLTDRDPAKLASLTDVAAAHFPVPPEFGARLARRFRAAHGELPADAAGAMFHADRWDWPTVRDSLIAGIRASATPDREDRLFPADPQVYAAGGHTVAYGAAGVLWALHQVGAEVTEQHERWLVEAARHAPHPRPGLLDGLHGVAATLDAIGNQAGALDLLDQARTLHKDLVAPGLHSGFAGAGLSLLHFARRTGAQELREEAVGFGERLGAQLADAGAPLSGPTARGGLTHGLTGVAHFLLALHEATGERRYLDLAEVALRHEVARGRHLPDGTFQLLEGSRYHAYLGTGSIGLALVLAQYLSYRPEPTFAAAVAGARLACRSAFIRHPFLLMGRAGTIAALSLLDMADEDLVRAHIARLGWHAVRHQGHLAFPGNQLLRLSADLATGAAGILVALDVALRRGASVIPLVDLRPAAGPNP